MDGKTELEYLSADLTNCKCGGKPKFICGPAVFEYTVRCRECGTENNQHENTRLKAFIRWEYAEEFARSCKTIAALRKQLAEAKAERDELKRQLHPKCNCDKCTGRNIESLYEQD